MRKYWIIVVLLLTSCAPKNTASIYPQTTSIPPPTPRKLATPTPLQPTPKATLTSPVFAPVSEQWLGLAVLMQGKAQQAINEKLWEDLQFKKEAYQISNQMIRMSEGKVKEDSTEVLKRFRWGMEFMDKGQLQEVIKILDQYD